MRARLIHRRARAKVIPFMAVLLGVMVLVAVFFFNTFGYVTLAGLSAQNAAHQAGLAWLQQVDQEAGLGRWEIDPVLATGVARSFATYNLVGMSEGTPPSGANYSVFFDLSGQRYTSLAELLADVNGTQNDAVDGMDVEIVVPAQAPCQTSLHYFNCDPEASPCAPVPVFPLPASGCDTTSIESYPKAVGSSLTGECYTHSAIIIRLRLHAFQMGSGSTQIERVVVTQAGTNG